MFLLRIIILGLIILGIYSVKYPEKFYLWGRKWMYEQDPELSDTAKDLIRVKGIIAVIAFGMILLASFIFRPY